MKKSKLITCLSAAFVSAMALMSCSSLIKSKSGVILTIDGVDYTAEDLFNDQKTPAAAEAKFNAVYKVAIRRHFQKGQEGEGDMKEIENSTKIKINEQKATAQSNADKNGTSYGEEWQKILDSNGVEDETGLYNKFEYELQKEKYENKFYDKNYEALRNGDKFPGLDDKGYFKNYLDGKQPYHIKHILIKLANAKAGDGVSAEISAKEAENLCDVIDELVSGTPFEDVSDLYNEDEGAKKNHGSLGIMSRDTSFVNDFKLGIYMYEAFCGSSTSKTTTTGFESIEAKTALGLNDATKGAGLYADKIFKLFDPTMQQKATTTNEDGVCIGQIPYGEVVKLRKYARVDFDDANVTARFTQAGVKKEDVAAKYLPRNVIFNKYFNKHNIMVITPNSAPVIGAADSYVTKTGNVYKRNNKIDLYRGKFTGSTFVDKPGFNYTDSGEAGKRAKNDDKLLDTISFYDDGDTTFATKVNTDKKVLRDNNGRVILVFHSGTGDSSSNDAYQGIHFVVIERSPFIKNEYDKLSADGSVDTNYKTTRNEYYTEFYPEQESIYGKHPKYPDSVGGGWKHTFVNYIDGEETKVLKERADTVKSELKKAVNRIDTYLYQSLIKEGNLHFDEKNPIATGIEKNINDWIDITRSSDARKQKKDWDDTWQTYYYSLAAQAEQREEKLVGSQVHSRLIPEVAAEAFVSDAGAGGIALSDLFGVGGVFHE